jgi:hypothetical protein
MGRFDYITLTTLMSVFTEMMNWRLLNTGQSTSILVILLPGQPGRNILKLTQDLQSYRLCMKSRIFLFFFLQKYILSQNKRWSWFCYSVHFL